VSEELGTERFAFSYEGPIHEVFRSCTRRRASGCRPSTRSRHRTARRTNWSGWCARDPANPSRHRAARGGCPGGRRGLARVLGTIMLTTANFASAPVEACDYGAGLRRAVPRRPTEPRAERPCLTRPCEYAVSAAAPSRQGCHTVLDRRRAWELVFWRLPGLRLLDHPPSPSARPASRVTSRRKRQAVERCALVHRERAELNRRCPRRTSSHWLNWRSSQVSVDDEHREL